jgi:hypothetical protein
VREAQASNFEKEVRMSGLVRKGAVLAAMVAAIAGGAVFGSSSANAGVGGCWSGIDAGTTDWAWGSCVGVTGSTHWRLHVSCTWGDTRYSSWFYGSGRTDVHCPFPERVRSTQIDIIY